MPRARAQRKATAGVPASAPAPRLPVQTARAVSASRTLTLPAGLVAYQQTLVYARASGYVRRWYVDIGDPVKAGQLLLELETPELDQQVAQARAALAQSVASLGQAKANREFAVLTEGRQKELVQKKLVAAQDYDQARTQADIWDANARAAEANVSAQRASLQQLQQLVAFGKVVAPFDGIITRRLANVGTLVNAGAGAAASALFEIATIDPMLAYVDVPQAFAPSIHAGREARLTLKTFGGRVFQGKVTRTAGALDPASRTLRTQVEIPNAGGELLAGMYGEVSLDVSLAHPVVRVPSTAIIADASGTAVATVQGGKVRRERVALGMDDGSMVDVAQGLTGGEQVLITPPANVQDGQPVDPVTTTDAPASSTHS
ncbi:MAG TPA: efflux RND transporter periplasmic adaptor subunit [Myxococcaceae bacterium]|nr:efflux RND transporter periplasmic adaptor subunit [Myxococcaceae bacterium]